MGSDLSVVNSARVSFNKESNFTIGDKLLEKDKKLINYLAKHKHITPFRHNQIGIRCKAPIFLARQLVKHQVGGSWNEVSRRYVDTRPEFFYPSYWRARPDDSIKQGSGIIHPESDYFHYEYKEVIKECLSLYEKMISQGVAPEMARMVLPQSMVTEWIWTGSLLFFFHVWNLRSDCHAQKEAQDFAIKLERIVKPLFPVSWEALKDNGV
jgi:thymidylate synthase (FAD)